MPRIGHRGAISMGVYNSNAGMSLSDRPRSALCAQRQLPSGDHGRHRRQSDRDRLWRCDVLCRFRRQPATPRPNQIANPDPMPGTNNWYTQDGYAGGSYVNCADASQPGVKAIGDYLSSLPIGRSAAAIAARAPTTWSTTTSKVISATAPRRRSAPRVHHSAEPPAQSRAAAVAARRFLAVLRRGLGRRAGHLRQPPVLFAVQPVSVLDRRL